MARPKGSKNNVTKKTGEKNFPEVVHVTMGGSDCNEPDFLEASVNLKSMDLDFNWRKGAPRYVGVYKLVEVVKTEISITKEG